MTKIITAVCIIVSALFTQSAVLQADTFTPIRTADSLAILALYHQTGGPDWHNNTDWLSQKPVDVWYGVQTKIIKVDTRELRVVEELQLNNNGVKGQLDDLNLPDLAVLEISTDGTDEAGRLVGQLPNFNLPALRELRLSDQSFSGLIPDLDLPLLEVLELNNNQFEGPIPGFNLPRLRELHLAGNNLDGAIPRLELASLEILDLGANQLTGRLPAFRLEYLRSLNVQHNAIDGIVPKWSTPALETLILTANNLSGPFQDFAALPMLATLDLRNNALNSLPAIDNFPQLKRLYAMGNKLTFAEIEKLIGAVETFFYSEQDTVLPIMQTTTSDGVLLSVTADGDANQYQWLRNGIEIDGAEDAWFKAQTSGEYECRVTNLLAEDLTLRSESAAISLEPVSVQDQDRLSAQFQSAALYPQPAQSEVTIAYSLASAAGVRIELCDLAGRRRHVQADDAQAAGSHLLTLQTTHLTPGTYLVTIYAGEDSRSLPLVIGR